MRDSHALLLGNESPPQDHESYATGRPNAEFQAVIHLLRTHPLCRARMHWRAGWGAGAPRHS